MNPAPKLRRGNVCPGQLVIFMAVHPHSSTFTELRPACSMTIKRFLLTAGAAFLLATPLFVSAQSSREIYAEANAIEAQDDKKLTAAYEALIKDIRAGHDKDQAELIIGSLRESQRAWLKYRDVQIDFVGTYNHIGSASARQAGLALYSRKLTEARVKDFQGVPDPF